MFKNYEMAMEWDVRELTGWDMEDMDKEMEEYNRIMEEEAREDAEQEKAYNEYLNIMQEVWGE